MSIGPHLPHIENKLFIGLDLATAGRVNADRCPVKRDWQKALHKAVIDRFPYQSTQRLRLDSSKDGYGQVRDERGPARNAVKRIFAAVKCLQPESPVARRPFGRSVFIH